METPNNILYVRSDFNKILDYEKLKDIDTLIFVDDCQQCAH